MESFQGGAPLSGANLPVALIMIMMIVIMMIFPCYVFLDICIKLSSPILTKELGKFPAPIF